MVAFLALAQQCAATSTLDLMVALASVSSGFDPFTVSVGGQRHSFQDAGRAVAGAVGAMDQGQDAAIGLMGLSAQRLNELGVTLADGFEPCHSLQAAEAASRLIEASARKRGVSVTRAIEIEFYVPGGRFKTAEAFADAVEAARKDANALLKTEIKGIAQPVARVAAAAKEVSGQPFLATGAQGRVRRGVAEPWDVFGDYGDQASGATSQTWDSFGDYPNSGSANQSSKQGEKE